MNLRTPFKTVTETLSAFYSGQIFVRVGDEKPVRSNTFRVGDIIVFEGKKLRLTHRYTKTFQHS